MPSSCRFHRHSISSLCLILLVTTSPVSIASLGQCAETIWPDREWSRADVDHAKVNSKEFNKARDYALSGGGSGMIILHGQIVGEWGDRKQKYDLKSSTKSIGATMLGVAILDGKVALTDKIQSRYPEFGTPPASNVETGWLGQITVLHLATQTAGFEKPGGYEKLVFEPGTKWSYSDGGPNWLADYLTLTYRRDIAELGFERVFLPLGMTRADLTWRENAYRPKMLDGIPRREFGAGVSANVDAMARIGLLYLRNGMWRDQRILPADFVRRAGTTIPEVVGLPETDPTQYGNASDHYGLLWWNNADGTLKNVPRDAFWSWGLYDSLIVVIPSLDLVVSRAGGSWKRATPAHYDVLQPFLEPIARACGHAVEGQDDLLERKTPTDNAGTKSAPPISPPYPRSAVIRQVDWSPAASIIRRARGSDNWPLTWADDDSLYTAYGDGRGFEPFVESKLSLGLARIQGSPPNIEGVNLRSSSIESTGDGNKGLKASGILMVKGTLYLCIRNVKNSQLAWSDNHGLTWTKADWKFEESFGCPTFLNFGRNYAGARDSFAYLYSHDSDSAYTPADRMILARTPITQIRERSAYQFFAGLDDRGQPTWTSDIQRRAAVFSHRQNCYRSGITFHPALKRYLWCQILPGNDPRFKGGLAIYDAPEPWGPWTTAYFNTDWDVGPGETASIPTKWLGDEGTFHLVFSGDDHFSVRKGTFRVSQ